MPDFGVNLRACLCGVVNYASAQALDFLDLGQKSSFPDWKHQIIFFEYLGRKTMDLGFTAEQDMLRKSVAEFISKECLFETVKELEDKEGILSRNVAEMAKLAGWS
ncbi:MAG: hypothetical protein R2875_14260 [Desulfobacterales bacterium]